MSDPADLKQRIAGLSPERRALLERWLMDGAAARGRDPGIPRRASAGPSPLSFSQQRLWFLQQMEPDLVAYNVPVATRLRGPLDVGALRRSLDAVVARHEVLRTTYVDAAPEPLQVVAPERTVDVRIVDLSGWPEAQRDAELRRRLAEEAGRPFDLAVDPILRVLLVGLGPDDHVLLLTKHHIASDGWSNGILLRELSQLYTAFSLGREPALPELPIQYADYALWQRQWLQGAVLENQLDYWRKKLEGLPPLLELPTDRPRPHVLRYRGSRRSHVMPPALSDALVRLGRVGRATLFMTLLAGFQTLLHRYTGQDDIAVGSANAGRTRIEVEPLIGFFVNTLVLREDLSGDPTFSQLLQRVRETALGAYGHQDLPFERLVQELKPERSLDRTPLIQVSFTMQDGTRPRLELPGITATPLDVDSSSAQFDLGLSITPTAEGIRIRAEHNADLFDGSTIARMLEHYQRLLEGAVADPGRRLSALPILGEEEHRQIVVDWNPRPSPLDPRPAHHVFAAQAARTPEAPAVIAGGAAWSFAALDGAAERLARRLTALGVGPDVLVGVCLERSPELVAALLAVWKAGGAYVPLDPTYPAQRLAFMLEDARAPVLVTHSSLRARLAATSARVVYVDEPASADPSPDRPAVAVPGGPDLDNLAYVIYTSGSTGLPKGAMVTHRGLANYLQWAMDAYRVTEGAGAPVSSSIAFDLTVTSLFAPLLSGRPAVLIEDGPGVTSLAEALRARPGMSLVKITPSHLELLAVELGSSEADGRARAFVIGGEALRASHLAHWHAHAPGTRLINEYGPTETVVGCAVHEATAGETPRESVPIGRPITNMRLHVLDRSFGPVPAGVIGELYIGGLGVARGYAGRPELTAERFVPDPFGGEPGARLYRTGDLARYLPDGVLEFLGRRDHQVKVRGYRIELGEIEAALAAHADVADCAVLAREDVPGDVRLVAYVASGGARRPAAPQLRRFLAERLPEHMLPSSFVPLDALPLTANGKVDRARLPAPERDAGDAASMDEAPRTTIEDKLQAIWSETLGMPRVGIRRHFFAIGGHSLLAVRVISRIAEVFGVRLPLRRLFERPTIAELADEVTKAQRGGEGARGRALAAVPRGGPLPLSATQEQFWLVNQQAPDDPVYNQAHLLRIRGALNVHALHRTLTLLVRRHEVLRTVYGLVDGKPAQTILEPREVELPIVDLSGLPSAERDAEAARIGTAEARRPFDLGRDLVLRGRLLRLGEDDHLFIFVTHHIALDASSTPLLVSELGTLYQATCEGRPAPLPALPLQYADYAVWQRQWLDDDGVRDSIDYWKRRLAGAPAALDLPTDRPRRPGPRSPGGREGRVLPRGLGERIRALGARTSTSPFMILLAAYSALLHRYSGADDIVVGSPFSGRDRAELQDLIGCFLNTLALRVDLSGDPSFGALLERVRVAALEAYDHKDAPFARVVEAVRPTRAAGRASLFQVMLTVLDSAGSSLRLADLDVQRIADVVEVGAMFDLLLFHFEEPDGGVRLLLQYATDLFDAERMQRLLTHLERVLEVGVADPGCRLSDLPLLTPEEDRRLAGWSAPPPRPAETSLEALVEAQVDRDRHAVAAEFGGQRLSYGELEDRANRLARHLRALGAGPDSPIGLCVERSLDMIVGVLGILKAGAAYVPLDPAYPRDRLGHMLDAARLPIIVSHARTTERLAALAAGGDAPRVVDLDRDAGALAQRPADRPERLATARDLLYVLFTSGSTGVPKAVAMPRGPIARLIQWQLERSTCGRGARTLQFAPYSFDVSCQELFATLAAGGTLCVVDEDSRLDPDVLVGILRRDRIERVFMPFVAIEQVAHAVTAGDVSLPALREVITAGEQLRITPALVELFRRAPGARLDNQYGPTECHVVSAHMLEGAPEDWPALPPIGRPAAAATLHVLDRSGAPVPVGVVGELYAGGGCLARGYLGRPDLTAERFLPDRTGEAGDLLYRTGDLARWRADGSLEYLGRVDEQVKIRGYRVEPGEIEAALGRIEGVREAVVVARDDDALGRRLVAYLVATGAGRPTPADLRAALKAGMPEYMVPSAFAWVEAFPRTPSGKVDRRALAASAPAEAGREEPDAEHVWPRDPLETELVGIWEDLLGVHPIGIADDFFERGGHSLLAVRMLQAVEKSCGRRLAVATLYEEATIRHLADVLRREGAEFHRSPAVLVQAGEKPPFFFLHGDYQGGGFYCIKLAQSLDPDQAFYALHPHGLDGEPVPPTVEAMAAEHLRSLRQLQPRGPYYLGGHCNGGLVAFEVAQQLRAMGEEVGLLVVMDTTATNTRARILLRRVRTQKSRLVTGARYYAKGVRRYGKEGPSGWVRLAGRVLGLGRPDPARAARVARAPMGLDEKYRSVMSTYVPRPYDRRVTVFRAAEFVDGTPDSGWSRISADVEVHVIPGAHLTFITRHVAILGERLRTCLQRARGV